MVDTAKRLIRSDSVVAYGAVLACWLLSIYLLFAMREHDTLVHYHLTLTGLRTVQALLTIPSLLIWLGMAFAFLSFNRYAAKIAGSKDSQGFRYISYALGLVLLSSIVVTLLARCRALFTASASDPVAIRTAFVVATNYVSILTALGTYGFLYKGSNALLGSIGRKYDASRHFLRIMIMVIMIATVYIFLVFSNPTRKASSVAILPPTFGMSDTLILFTVAIPYVLSWALGILALDGLKQYLLNAKGLVYKKLFKQLLSGLTLMVSATIFYQLIHQFTSFWARSSVTVTVSIIVVTYLILIVAYVMVAKGARQLNKIEMIEVHRN